MSDIENINLNPELLTSTVNKPAQEQMIENEDLFQNDFDFSSDEEETPFIKDTPNIFVVNIDGHPRFYCHSFNEAKKQACRYLNNLHKNYDYHYRLNTRRKIIELVSTYKLCIVKFERIESVAEIVVIPKLNCRLFKE